MRPSFWAVTGHREPWEFLRKDPDGYKMFIDTLPTLETGTEGEKIVFREWSHLLRRQPTKEDRSVTLTTCFTTVLWGAQSTGRLC